jgi:hypothetical protein
LADETIGDAAIVSTIAGVKGAVQTFIIDWPILLFLGILFGSFAPAESWWRSRPFLAGLATALVFTTIAFISYAVAPEWMWMYFLTPSDVAWALPGIAIGYVAVFALGFAAAVGLKPLGARVLASAAVTMLIGEIGVVALTWSRYHLIGTRQEWTSGTAHELFTASPSGPVTTIGLLGPVFVVVFVIALFVTWRSGRAPVARR